MSSFTKALCLLLAVVVVMTGAASAAAAAAGNNKINKPLPGSCLVAASTLCSNADTNAMRCLRKLAIKGDARVPSACAEAVMAGVTVNPRFKKKASRISQLARLLNEGGACTGANTCVTANKNQDHQQCNDVADGCNGCPLGTATVPTSVSNTVVGGWFLDGNPNDIACSRVCCDAGANGGPACCVSSTSSSGIIGTVVCVVGAAFCNPV